MTSIAPDIAARRRRFREMHTKGCFVLPNPWDVGSALYLQRLGFAALATTSSGLCWSHGVPDGELPLETVLDHFTALVHATDVPVNADFGNGLAADAHGVALNVARAVGTGVAGVSIEDATGDAGAPLFDIATAASRVQAARRAIDEAGGDTLLVGRAEGRLFGQPDLAEVITRLQAYAAAGADCLYAPGVTEAADIAAVVAAVAPKPVNVLVGSASPLTVADLAALGVRRISVGGAMARTAWGAFGRAAQLLAGEGRFDGFAGAASGAMLNGVFSR